MSVEHRRKHRNSNFDVLCKLARRTPLSEPFFGKGSREAKVLSPSKTKSKNQAQINKFSIIINRVFELHATAGGKPCPHQRSSTNSSSSSVRTGKPTAPGATMKPSSARNSSTPCLKRWAGTCSTATIMRRKTAR